MLNYTRKLALFHSKKSSKGKGKGPFIYTWAIHLTRSDGLDHLLLLSRELLAPERLTDMIHRTVPWPIWFISCARVPALCARASMLPPTPTFCAPTRRPAPPRHRLHRTLAAPPTSHMHHMYNIWSTFETSICNGCNMRLKTDETLDTCFWNTCKNT
jgi:hypothetical protein